MRKKEERARERDQADATVEESISAASSLTKRVHGKVRIFEETVTLCSQVGSTSRREKGRVGFDTMTGKWHFVTKT